MNDESDPDLPKKLLIEQYKTCLTMADTVSNRRVQAGTFYLSVMSALLALLALTGDKFALSQVGRLVQVVVCVQGLLVAFVWWLTVESYRQLNSSKFKAIQALEAQLPCQPFADEWKDLMASRYKRLSKIERVVPLVLGIPFAILLMYQVFRLVSPASS